MKYYRIIDPDTGAITIETEIGMRQAYYEDRALKQRLCQENNARFHAGDPDYKHMTAHNFTFADYLEQLKDEDILKGEF